MANNSNGPFGFELLHHIYRDQVVKKEDVLVLFVHWYLVKDGFRCTGLGNSIFVDPSDKGSELLPEEWNKQPNYTLRYLKNKKTYILVGVKLDENMLFNLMKNGESTVTNVQFPLESTVNELHGPLESVIPSYQLVISTLRTDLVEPMNCGTETHSSTQTPSQDFLGVQPRPPRTPEQPPYSDFSRQLPPSADPRRIGQDDLNPFGNVGGGMLFDPFGHGSGSRRPGLGDGTFMGVPGRIPPGSVPPGARFDPIGPRQPRLPIPRNQPDNDHMPFPGMDNMFM